MKIIVVNVSFTLHRTLSYQRKFWRKKISVRIVMSAFINNGSPHLFGNFQEESSAEVYPK